MSVQTTRYFLNDEPYTRLDFLTEAQLGHATSDEYAVVRLAEDGPTVTEMTVNGERVAPSTRQDLLDFAVAVVEQRA